MDIDGFFGPISFDNFSTAILNNINININNCIIQTKTSFVFYKDKVINVSEICHLHLGTISLPAGNASLFYMAPDFKSKDSLTTFVNNSILSSDAIMSKYDSSSTKSFVPPTSIGRFINHVINNTTSHPNDFFFIESFGSKNNTLVTNIDSPDSIISILTSNFNISSFPYLMIDFAVCICSKSNHVVFPDCSFFNNSNIKPNYFLFFNYNLANSNGNCYTYLNNTISFESSLFIKRNLYSIVEDIIVPIRKSNDNVPGISTSILSNKLSYNNKVLSSSKPLLTILDGLNKASNMSWPYRIELRTTPSNLSTVLSFIKSCLSNSGILLYPSDQIFSILINSFNNMYNQVVFTDITIYKLFNSMFMEHLLINSFLKGSSSNIGFASSLKHQYPKLLMKNSKNISVVNPKLDTTSFSVNEIIFCLTSFISSNYHLLPAEKDSLNNIVNTVGLDIEQATKSVMLQYCNDMACLYQLDTSIGLNLLRSLNSTNTSKNAVSMDLAVIQAFNIGSSELFYSAMISLYLLSNEMDEKVWLNTMKQFILSNQLDMVFNHTSDRKKPATLFSKLVNKTGSNLSMINDAALINRAELIKKLDHLIVIQESANNRREWSDDEKIRLLAVRNVYEAYNTNNNGVWTYACATSIFGFLYTRKLLLIKDTFTRIGDMSEPKRISLYYEASKWTPKEFSIDQVIDHMKSFGVSFNDEAMAIFRKIYNYDLEEYNLFSTSLSGNNNNALSPTDENIESNEINNISTINTNKIIKRIDQLEVILKTEMVNIVKQSEMRLRNYIDQRLEEINHKNKTDDYVVLSDINDNMDSLNDIDEFIRVSNNEIPRNMQLTLFDFKNNLLDEPRNIIDNQVDDKNNINHYKQFLLKKYRNSNIGFTKIEARRELTSKKRPNSSGWDDIINTLVDENFISIIDNKSKIKRYKINK